MGIVKRNCPEAIALGGNCLGAIVLGGICPGVIVEGAVVQGAIVCWAIIQGDIVLELSSSALSKSNLSTAELLQQTPWQSPYVFIHWISCFCFSHWFWLSDQQLQRIMDISSSGAGDWKKIGWNLYDNWLWL